MEVETAIIDSMVALGNRLIQGAFWDPSTLFGAIAYLLVFLFVASAIAWGIHRAGQQALRRDRLGILDRTAAYFFIQFSEVFVFVVAIILYAHIVPQLRSLGTALLTGVSVSAVIIGLAAQNTLGNFISGISLLVYRPFRVGDRLQVNGPSGLETGIVENVMLAYTTLTTYDNRRIVVPNSMMANQIMVNLTGDDPKVMAIVPIGIAYTSDIEKARSTIIELARSHLLVLEVVSCPVVELGASSVLLSLRAWCANPGDAKIVEYDLYEQVKKRFDEKGIEIPYPYSNVILTHNQQRSDREQSHDNVGVSRNGL